ncbi:hypothetical protein U8C31_18295 [Sinorhizobium medicae]|uniref:hypothetical protein n=1 Tax=Sinorhizobium medicae TaxID=110321 RepID=UPI002AF6ADC7|nr:hypothetical protein [Sinorhizobium medicae]WQO72187.1 hypothetical protein U8C31_18295 [Sinorhizobium medicae]
MLRISVLLLGMLGILSPVASKADALYDSLTQSIASTEAQAYIWLSQGQYVTENGRSRIIWKIPKDTRTTLRFRYSLGTIQDGLIDFGAQGTSFLIRSESLCSKITVRRIAVLPGGAIDESESDYTLAPPSRECREPRSQLEQALEDIVSLQIDPAKTFSGRVFSGSDDLRICPNPECNGDFSKMKVGQPVYKFTAFSTDGENAANAFEVELQEGAALQLPNSAGFIKLASGSGVKISQATYDLRRKQGSGVMRNLSVNVDEGVLNFGSTILALASGSELTFDDLSIAQRDGVTTIDRGSLTGTLGGNSLMTVKSAAGQKSQISIAQASVTLTGLNMTFDKNLSVLTGRSGELKILANSADLYLSDELHLLMGSTNIGLIFQCEASDGPDCRPFSWSNDGSIVAIGHFLPMATTLNGGYIAFPEQNRLQIDRGDIQTSDLLLDSREDQTPITGSVTKLDLRFSAQDWKIDQNLRIGTGDVRLSSQDLSIQSGDSFPVGNIKLEGTISEINAGGIGRVPFATATTNITLEASRRLKDDLKINNGRVSGQLKFQGDLATAGEASFELRDLLYYRGVGSAKFDFHVDEARSHYVVDRPVDAEEGFPGGRTVLHVTRRDIPLTLKERFGFADADVKVNDGIWSITEQKGLPVSVDAVVSTGELVNIKVQLGGGDLAGKNYTTVCSPHVNVNRADYTIKGLADLTLSNSSRRFKVADVTLVPDFDADVDDRNCKEIAAGICGIIGTLLTGGNLIAGAAAGIACGNEVEKHKKDMHGEFADKAAAALANLKLGLTF